MSTLLVDNYDSYTYNVFHLLAAASGEEPIVVHNDMVSWRALSRWGFDAIVLSPGPGRPERWHDFGVCSDILRCSEIPVLGICLGHQGLGNLLNGMVATAPMAMHGRLSRVRHVDSGLFAGIPQDFSVVRYHSLAVTGARARGPRDRVDRRRRRDGHRTPHAPDLGRAVPPRVDRHRVRAQARRELLRARAPPPTAAPRRRAQPPRRPPDRRRRRAHDARQRRSPRSVPSCACARSRASLRPSPCSNASSATPSTLSGSTAPTRRRAWRSAPTSARARAPSAACSSTTSPREWSRRIAPSEQDRARLDLRHARPRALDRAIEPPAEPPAACSVASSAISATSARPTAARPTRTAPTARRGADARQPRRRGRPRRPAHRPVRALLATKATRRTPSAGSTRPSGRARALAAGAASPRRGPARGEGVAASVLGGRRRPAAEPPVDLPLRPRPRAVPRRHRPLPGRARRRRVLRGLPDRPDLDRREPRAVRRSIACCGASTRRRSPPT